MARTRLVTRLYGSEPSMIAIDNVECRTIVTTPMVERVTSENSPFQDRPDAGDSTILCYLSAGFTERSVTYQGNVKVFQSGRELAVGQVSYDSGRTALSIALDEPLKPEKSYLVTVSGSTILADGTPLGREMTGCFQAAPRILEVEDTRFENGIFTAELINHSGEAKQVYLFVNRIKDGRLVGSEVHTYALKEESTSVRLTPQLAAGEEAELFVWDGIPGSYTLSDVIVKN